MELGFHGHYGESNLQFSVPRYLLKNKTCRLEMIFCPIKKQWVQLNVQDVKTHENIDLIEFKTAAPTTAIEDMRTTSSTINKSQPKKT